MNAWATQTAAECSCSTSQFTRAKKWGQANATNWYLETALSLHRTELEDPGSGQLHASQAAWMGLLENSLWDQPRVPCPVPLHLCGGQWLPGWGWRLKQQCSWSWLLLGDENILKLAGGDCTTEYRKNPCIVHFKWMNCLEGESFQ